MPERDAKRSMEAEFFRMINQIVEPAVRAGWGSPGLSSGGFIVLETEGRITGNPSRVPLAALQLNDHVLVSTYRGRRSNWVKNIRANPHVQYWIGGRPRAARAMAVASPEQSSAPEDWPLLLRWMLPVVSYYVCAGWAFALLGPDDSPDRDNKDNIDAGPSIATALESSI